MVNIKIDWFLLIYINVYYIHFDYINLFDLLYTKNGRNKQRQYN